LAQHEPGSAINGSAELSGKSLLIAGVLILPLPYRKIVFFECKNYSCSSGKNQNAVYSKKPLKTISLCSRFLCSGKILLHFPGVGYQ